MTALPVRWFRAPLMAFAALAVLAAFAVPAQGQTAERWWDPADPRIGLRAGFMDAGEASWNMRLVTLVPKPDHFLNPNNPGDFAFANSDLAFQGDLVVMGNFGGFNIYNVSNPESPQLVSSVVCPGGQGDVSIYGNLLFMSVEQASGRIDCGAGGAPGPVNPERFLGVRIFDISNIGTPVQIAAVQTCRGSHTHSILADPSDPANLYVYVSGTGRVRSAEELPGCSGATPDEDPDATSLFRIEVIRVPLAAPQDAEVIAAPRVFANEGRVDGLWPGGDHGDGTQRSAQTNHCHDITIYPDIGLAGGACSGNGILLDVTNPGAPTRATEVIDENFAYWHSATFNNDGTTVIFTDEWGGGTSPRCRESDLPTWGANAFFRLVNGEMEHVGYYKLPVPQTDQENCVAHNGSLVPVPGRDIKVQAWYQGGTSVFDFTDPSNPFEIAYFDRGPISAEQAVLGGHWSSYWYNGKIYASEIARGLDIFELTPSQYLTQNELDAARAVIWDEFNPQHQTRITWEPSWVVARAYVDQLQRSRAIDPDMGMQGLTLMTQAEEPGAAGAAARAELRGALPMLQDVLSTFQGRDRERAQGIVDIIRALTTAQD